MQKRLCICLLVPLRANLSIFRGEVSIPLDSDLERGLMDDGSRSGHVEPLLKNKKNERVTHEIISYFKCTVLYVHALSIFFFERLLHKVDI